MKIHCKINSILIFFSYIEGKRIYFALIKVKIMNESIWIKAKKYIRSLKFGIVFYNVFILIFSVSFVIIYSKKNNDEIIIQNLQSFMELSNKNIIGKIYDEFDKIGNILTANVSMLHGLKDTDSPPDFVDEVFFNLLYRSKYISSIYYAKKNNYFSLAMSRSDQDFYKSDSSKKLPENTAFGWSVIFETDKIDGLHVNEDEDEENSTILTPYSKKNTRFERWHYFDQDKKLLDTEQIYNNSFLPTLRPWYSLAEFSKVPKWTEAYLFQLSRVPGITAAVGIIDKDKNSKGILAIDLTLSKLNDLLNNLKMTSTSQMYIIDYLGNILASTETLKLKESSNQKFRLPSINDEELRNLKTMLGQKDGEAPSFIADLKGGSYVVQRANFKFENLNWKIININSVDDILSPNMEKRQITIALSFVLMILSAFIMFLFARKISQHISRLSESAEKITHFDTTSHINVESSILEIQQLSDAMKSMQSSMDSFSKYVPRELVKRLIDGKGGMSEIGGEHKEITLFFSDIAGFTAISENLKPQELIKQLTDYFSSSADIIMKNDGVVDKFIGDAIMAFWGAPDENANQAYDACLSALQVQRFLKLKNSDWINLGLPPFATRIGIHTDTALVGNIGAKNRMNYTAIGDSVNLAARLEGLNKHYNTSILISQDVYNKVNGDFLARPLGKVAVKGKDKSVGIYELVSALKHVDTNLLISPQATRDHEKYLVAYEYFSEQRFKSALEILQDIHMQDGPVTMLIEECKKLIKSPPESDWDGLVRKMDVK